MGAVKIVCISDTHTHHDKLTLPAGDVLVCAGDFTYRGRENEIRDFNRWLSGLDFGHRIVVAGNHDFMFQRNAEFARGLLTSATYLQDSGTLIDGIKFWGTPWQPWFHDWAFNLREESERQVYWDMIPDDTDVLISHSPPYGILDKTYSGEHVGCRGLLSRVRQVRPQLHVFGHIHEEYGTLQEDGVQYVNAANCDLAYRARRPPIVIEVGRRPLYP